MKIEERKFKTGYRLKAGENIIELIGDKKGGYDFNVFSIKDSKNKKLIIELRKRFYEFGNRERCIIQSEDSERDRKQSKFLVECGFDIKYSRQLFYRHLSKYSSPYEDIFFYYSIYETGIKEYYKILRSSVYKPVRSLEKFQKYLSRIKKEYQNFDLSKWKTAFLHDKPIGIIMPFKMLMAVPPEFSIKKEIGTILNIGIIPVERGKGYGRIIHSKGLEILKNSGLKVYLGSTTTDNYAMLKVFKMNNCRKCLTQNFYYIK